MVFSVPVMLSALNAHLVLNARERRIRRRAGLLAHSSSFGAISQGRNAVSAAYLDSGSS